jgi:nucleoside-diphosphate-sugar epimerase
MKFWLKELLKLSDIKVRIQMDPERRRLKEPQRILVDSKKFRKATGWKETRTLEEVFIEVLNWWRAHV